jgi:hypothetical protein
MTLGTLRRQLSRDDAQLALRLIARGSATELERAEQALRDGGLDALLDDPRLLTALTESRQGAHSSLPLFMYVVVRNALRRAGEGDRGIADYVASILVHFGMRNHAHRISESDDEVYDSLAQLAGDMDCADARRAFLVQVHLGNYALWMSGMFPDFIEHRRWRRGGPDLDYYEELGRRGYKLAADHRLAAEHGLTTLFATAAERFGLLRCALNQVSDALMFPGVSSPERLMRQVRDEARWRLLS